MDKFMFTDQDYNLWWSMLQTRRAMHKARRRELAQYGITPTESAVLLVVKTIGYRATPAKISRWLLREPNTTSSLLGRMEKDGLIKNNKDLERKNLIRVELTEKGHEAYDRAIKVGSIHRIMSCLSQEERQQLNSCLLKLWKKSLKEFERQRKPSY